MLLICTGANASAYDEALQTAAIAAYKQSGTEAIMNKFVEDKVPKKYRDFVAKVVPVLDAGINSKVEFKWTF